MTGEYEAALALTLKKLRATDRFESEVRGWLAPYSSEVVEQVVEFLRKHRMLDDVRAAESFSRRKSMGAERLRDELERRGAVSEAITAVLPSPDAERQAIRQLLVKRYSAPTERARAGRFLASRGFSPDLIESELDRHFREGLDG